MWARSGEPIRYAVSGLPPDQQVVIQKLPHHENWKVQRMINGQATEWEGAYETAEEAQTDLEGKL